MIDILRGADTAKIRQHGHQSLSTYGIGSDLDASQWRSVFRQLVSTGLLEVDIEGHGSLRLTAARASVLTGGRTLQRRRAAPAPSRRRERTRGAASTAPDLAPDAAERFERLRTWRGETARAQSVPAYVIFHDSTLRDIAVRRPEDLDALATVNGVGMGKLERYGAAVLDVLVG